MGTPEDVAAEKYFTPPEDKEAQEKIDQILVLRIKSLLMWGHNATEEEYKNNFDDCIQYHLKQLKEEIKYKLGYRKLPEPPPLLIDNPYIYESEECRQHTAFDKGKRAQRDSDIKWYGGE